MERRQRGFLTDLLETPSPSGFEADGQRVWTEYVSAFADEVRTDAYGNAVAVHEGRGGDGMASEDGGAGENGRAGDSGGPPTVAFGGHADEIGLIVRRIDEDGFVRLGAIGGSDRTVTKGQHVTVHAADGPVAGVVGQRAIHLRDPDDEEDLLEDIDEQIVDVGAAADEARELVEVGDPITVSGGVSELAGTRLAARGMDNRVGTWAAAEGLRRAVEADVDATVYAVSTVQEELGLQGARMAGYDLAPDAFVAVDVTHATDDPTATVDKGGDVALGDGPVVARGSANHPELVRAAREAAREAGVDVQLQAAGSYTGTDADAVYTQRGGVPSLNVGVPNRYMHTPVEVVDTDDLVAVADLLGALADVAGDYGSFSVDV